MQTHETGLRKVWDIYAKIEELEVVRQLKMLEAFNNTN